MTKIILTHEYTPSILLDITQQLEKLLSENDPDDKQLLSLVSTRDDVLVNFLQTLSKVDKQNFVQAELVTNTKLTEATQKLLKSSFTELSKHIRGQKAVQKYK